MDIQKQDHNNYLHNETIVSLVHNHLGPTRGKHCKQLLDNNSGQFVLAIVDNHIVGCACYGPAQFQAQTWWLGFCVVDPEFRNLGISNQLVDYRLNKIRDQHGRWVLVSPLEPIERFSKLGFVVLHKQPPEHHLMLLELN